MKRNLNYLNCLLLIFTVLMTHTLHAQVGNIPELKPIDSDEAGEKGRFPVQSVASAQMQSGTEVFSENFDAGTSSWTISGDWTSTYTGELSAASSPGVSSFLVSPSVTITDAGLNLFYREKYDIEALYDYGSVWISEDNGASWRMLHMVTGKADWHNTRINLSLYKGKTVKFAFATYNDGSVEGQGWQIDDVYIAKRGSATSSARVSSSKTSSARLSSTASTLNAVLTNLNAQNFPFVFANVRVDNSVCNLTQSDFVVRENGAVQTDFFDVVPPEEGDSRIADIIFIVDNSGSMGPQQAAINNETTDFVNGLVAAGVNFRLGLTRFGQSLSSGAPIIENNGILTDNAQFFLNNIFSRNRINGGREPGLAATQASINGFSFSPGGQKIFILVTDEDSDINFGGTLRPSRADVLNSLQQNSVTLNAVVDANFGTTSADYIDLATATNGGVFDVDNPDFSSILSDISSQISDTYLVRYRSSEPTLDGVTRNVEIEVTCNTETATATGQYIPGAAPEISLTAPTAALLTTGQEQNVSLNIEALITDAVSPFVQSALLFYKNTNGTSYTSVPMTNVSGDIWEAVIPGAAVQNPGVDFYITATDGNLTSALPSTLPADNPFQIAVLPNVPSAITFTPIERICTGKDFEVTAEVVDNTNQVSSVELFYKNTGELLYNSVSMVAGSGDNFSASLPAADIPATGVDYYIAATDDFGVTTLSGAPDAPFTVVPSGITNVTLGNQSFCDFSTNTYTQELVVSYDNAPSGGNLLVNGQSFAITSSPQTVTLTGLTCDNSSVNVSVAFEDSPTCPVSLPGLFIAPGGNFATTCATWDGTQWVDGIEPDATLCAVIESGTLMTSKPYTSLSLEVKPGARLVVTSGNYWDVKEDVFVDATGELTVESGGTFLSYDGFIFDGEMNYIRNTSFADGRYSMVSSPVQTATIGDVGKAFAYDEPSSGYITMSSSDAMNLAEGYYAYCKETVTFSGKPNTGDITLSLPTGTSGWNIIGNPYSAAISADAFLGANANNVQPTIYIWNSNIQNGSCGYLTYNYMGSVGTVGGITAGTTFNGSLGAAQGFFVEVNSNADVIFTEDMRLTGDNSDDSYLREIENKKETEKSTLKLVLSDGQLYDETLIGFANDATEGWDTKYDSRKLLDSPFEELKMLSVFSQLEGEPLAIQGLANLDNVFNSVSVDIGSDLPGKGDYEFKIGSNNMPDWASVLLEDKHTGTLHNLLEKAYQFSAGGGMNENRFKLWIGKVEEGNHLSEFNIYGEANTLSIWSAADTENATVKVYNLQGQPVNTNSYELGGSERLDMYVPGAGIYIVSVKTEGNVQISKVLVKP